MKTGNHYLFIHHELLSPFEKAADKPPFVHVFLD